MTTTAKPILFLAFANDRDERARYLRSLVKETGVLARRIQTGYNLLTVSRVTVFHTNEEKPWNLQSCFPFPNIKSFRSPGN